MISFAQARAAYSPPDFARRPLTTHADAATAGANGSAVWDLQWATRADLLSPVSPRDVADSVRPLPYVTQMDGSGVTGQAASTLFAADVFYAVSTLAFGARRAAPRAYVCSFVRALIHHAAAVSQEGMAAGTAAWAGEVACCWRVRTRPRCRTRGGRCTAFMCVTPPATAAALPCAHVWLLRRCAQNASTLIGGSGGAAGGAAPDAVAGHTHPLRGGSGGGALALVAAIDVTLGPNCALVVDGEAGSPGHFSGGGGRCDAASNPSAPRTLAHRVRAAGVRTCVRAQRRHSPDCGGRVRCQSRTHERARRRRGRRCDRGRHRQRHPARAPRRARQHCGPRRRRRRRRRPRVCVCARCLSAGAGRGGSGRARLRSRCRRRGRHCLPALHPVRGRRRGCEARRGGHAALSDGVWPAHGGGGGRRGAGV